MQQMMISNDTQHRHRYQIILRLFLWISVYRTVNVWILRTQFDPDEYWQTLEPAYCLVFGPDGKKHSTFNEIEHDLDRKRLYYGCALTWEWTRRWTPHPTTSSEFEGILASSNFYSRSKHFLYEALHGPVRSYVPILPTYVYYLACRPLLKWADESDSIDKSLNDGSRTVENYYTAFRRNLKQFIRQHSTYIISKGPVFLHAVLVAAPTDLMVWLISSRMNSVQSDTQHSRNEGGTRSSWPYWALVCSLTSWFHGYALVRTYANSVETFMLMLGITLLGPELIGQIRPSGTSHRGLNGSSTWRARIAFILGGLSVCVRFTSLAAWIPIGLILVLGSTSKIRTLFGLCAHFGLVGVLLGCCVDRWFYGFWAIPFLGNIHFNVLLGHGSLYGTHPFLWYVYAGIPAICGAMLPFFIWDVTTIRSGPRSVLIWIIAPYIILHSFSEHKEFRFLLPVLPIICILVGHALSRLVDVTDNEKTANTLKRLCKTTLVVPSNLILVALIILNFPHLFYLGLIHQRGPIATNQYLGSVIEKEPRQSSPSEPTRQYSIHFLMGCHSAPMYSHLHVSNARIEAWHLDCSPECRSNSHIVCESDAFLNDPLGFVTLAYNRTLAGNDDSNRDIPSFLVMMQDDAVNIESFLVDQLKMTHEASIRHTIKSLSWHRQDQCDSSNDGQCSLHATQHDPLTLFSRIDIHFDHMEVYKSLP